ncbi:MAG: nucleoside recognition protein [Bacillota bacterium]|nr:nucleoside recognition protein [Bacillota bacterium]
MLNGIWGFFMIGGILTGAFLGRMDLVTQAVIGGGKSAMELAFTMAGVVAVWSGVLKIAERGGMIDRLAGEMNPLLDVLFPSVPRRHRARKYIAANFAANFLGLGWAATPAGLRAMEELQKLNREEQGTASAAMCMFLTVNMTSLQLVTVNILAYRTEYGSGNPAEIIGVGIAATLITTLAGTLAAKGMERRKRNGAAASRF